MPNPPLTILQLTHQGQGQGSTQSIFGLSRHPTPPAHDSPAPPSGPGAGTDTAHLRPQPAAAPPRAPGARRLPAGHGTGGPPRGGRGAPPPPPIFPTLTRCAP